jgi:hypothetical protein
MDIQIDEKSMRLGEHRLEYDAYYFDPDEYAELSSGEVLREILRQWAAALAGLKDGQTIFLPFSLDDEWVECLKVTRHGDRLTSTQQIRKETPEAFGEWDKEEFISALLNAKVTAA